MCSAHRDSLAALRTQTVSMSFGGGRLVSVSIFFTRFIWMLSALEIYVLCLQICWTGQRVWIFTIKTWKLNKSLNLTYLSVSKKKRRCGESETFCPIIRCNLLWLKNKKKNMIDAEEMKGGGWFSRRKAMCCAGNDKFYFILFFISITGGWQDDGMVAISTKQPQRCK